MRLFTIVVLVGAGCTTTEEGAWDLVLPADVAREDVVLLHTSIVRGGCGSTSEPVYESSFEPGATGAMPPSLPSGLYGLAAEASDAGCRTIAAGCNDVSLPAGDGERHRVELSRVSPPRSRCGTDERCDIGACVSTTDAGTGDAGPIRDGGDDGGEEDAGDVDAGPAADAGPDHVHPIVCRTFNDGVSDPSMETDAWRVTAAFSVCADQGASPDHCRRWFGRCRPLPAAGHQHTELYWHAFDDAEANITTIAFDVTTDGPGRSCVNEFPGGSFECRKWFGAARVNNADTDGHMHDVACRVFDDDGTESAPDTAAFWNGSAMCVPGPRATPECRRWFGRCVTR